MQTTVPKGQQIFLGAPASPMPQERVAQLSSLVAATPGILEAHLPQCFIPGSMESPAQVLFVVVAPGSSPAEIGEQLGRGLTEMLPSGEHLDVMPLDGSHQLLSSVRGAGCSLTVSQRVTQKRQWWRFR
ncbi:MAG: enhanced serine sensitivity protein SseB C-terminal domain-containing protein [Thioalkalivibrio sp.]|nr:enhanced serine sensitivity protein SseB C-terminal domain-containing protein [Thioalkalivibrio sp.]